MHIPGPSGDPSIDNGHDTIGHQRADPPLRAKEEDTFEGCPVCQD